MEMQTTPVREGVVSVVLVGRLDVMGAGKIDLPFNLLVGSNRGMIVDMAGVDFLASMGIRTLLLGAKTMQRRGGKLVLVAPQPEVAKVLEVTGVLDLLPIAATHDEASGMIAH